MAGGGIKVNGDRTGEPYFIGWDVGAWYCDKNQKSRDAIVILDADRGMVGTPWRGSLRELINGAQTTRDWITGLFEKCKATPPGQPFQVTMAIDTPLGFSEEYLKLVTGSAAVDRVGEFKDNRYLFRHTERHLRDQGLKPLSAVQDQLGSQATKGMHVLANFAPKIESCGVWTDGEMYTAIESYPAPAREAASIKRLLVGRNRLKPDDIEDARTCALVAYLFATEREALNGPGPEVPQREGWIWLPRDWSSGHR